MKHLVYIHINMDTRFIRHNDKLIANRIFFIIIILTASNWNLMKLITKSSRNVFADYCN